MDNYFENSCLLNRRNLAEMARRTVNIWLRILCYVLGLLLILLVVLETGMRGFGFTAGLYLVLGLLVIMAAYNAPTWAANRSVKRNYTLYKRDPEMRVSFREDKIHVRNLQSGAEHDLEYAMVQKVVETAHLYIVILEGKLAVLADKQGFVIGREEDFRKFIVSKCGEKVHLA